VRCGDDTSESVLAIQQVFGVVGSVVVLCGVRKVRRQKLFAGNSGRALQRNSAHSSDNVAKVSPNALLGVASK